MAPAFQCTHFPIPNSLPIMRATLLLLCFLPCIALAQQINSLPNTGKVGIGTTTPTKELEVHGTSKLHGDLSVTDDLEVQQNFYSNGNVTFGGLTGNGIRYLTVDGNGKVSTSPSPVAGSNTHWSTNGNTINQVDKLGTLNAHDLDIITNNTNRVTITASGTVEIGNPTYTTNEVLKVGGNTRISRLGVGGAPVPSGYNFSVAGKAICTDIEVRNTGLWPDYVFEPEYELRSITELEHFVQRHQHLPGVASAAETANGVSVAELNKQMLEKIEELSLYIIQLHHRIEELENAQQ